MAGAAMLPKGAFPPNLYEAPETLYGRASQAALSFIGSSHASTAHCAAAISPKASM